ncbi:type IV pilus assembly protein PilB [Solimonas aquatica]|uniref:Type IV pilus assembly protein PilB n=1 Tax=Solimonas aquatica TaxID=489703 RepID=A0A1H9GMJ7_9GAMM|nr:ATPase, T2SS/T4P/T4SS family [Solimonas aquatica]SEQ51269.1 type IV pilus assembly protein PilB [Solimonas aquatica]
MSQNRADYAADAEPLLRRLLAEALLSSAQLGALRERARLQNTGVVQQLLQDTSLPQSALAQAFSRETGWPLLDLEAFVFDSEALALPMPDAQLLPLCRQDQALVVALADPQRLPADAALIPVLVAQDQLQRALQRRRAQTPAEPGSSEHAEDESAVRLIDRVLREAIAAGASDVHFEPYAQRYRIRRRLDGELRVVARPAASLAPRLAARLKVMAGLDLAERRLPQDGRIDYALPGASGAQRVDLRLSSCPTLHGEKIVCRILDPKAMPLDLDALGYEPAQREAYQRALAQPQGLILVTGPTGSGKTVSLYAALAQLNGESRNIATAEDPAEIDLPGINQLNINPKAGLNFATALRAFLRQDPDVIMVGEIRDSETAEIAIKAAQTGHLVLSTLHTNDAPQSVTRLLHMGLPAYQIAATLSLVIAQRLVRKLCPVCRQVLQLPREALLEQGFSAEDLQAPDFQLYRARGCAQCQDGYAGRCGVFQVMPFSEAMGALLLRGASARELAAQATRENVLSLRRAALRKAAAGLTDLAQVYAATVAD